MDILLSIWESLQYITCIVFYISIVILLVLLEKHFIQKRSRGELLLPVIALAAAAVLSVTTLHVTYSISSGLEHTQVFAEHREVGRVVAVYDKDQKLKALGQYIREDDEKTAFIDLKVEEGKVTGNSLPISESERKGIEEVLSYRNGRTFSGNSMSYEELLPVGEKYEFSEERVTMDSFLRGMIWYGLPGGILLCMYLVEKGMRYRRNAVKKIKLKDL